MFERLSNFWQRATDERRGITTSEFWMTLGTLLTTVTGTLFGILKPVPAGIVTALIVFGYCISRGLAKRHDRDNDDEGAYERRAWRTEGKNKHDDDR